MTTIELTDEEVQHLLHCMNYRASQGAWSMADGKSGRIVLHNEVLSRLERARFAWPRICFSDTEARSLYSMCSQTVAEYGAEDGDEQIIERLETFIDARGRLDDLDD